MAKNEIACKQGCGKTFTTEGWRVKHELRCNGKPIATSGRIEANGGVPERTKKSERTAPARATARRSTKKGNAHVVAPVVVTPAQMIAALRAEQAKLQNAIAAIEALG